MTVNFAEGGSENRGKGGERERERSVTAERRICDSFIVESLVQTVLQEHLSFAFIHTSCAISLIIVLQCMWFCRFDVSDSLLS